MEAQVAWRELTSALAAVLAGAGSPSTEIHQELAGMRGALRDAVVKSDYTTHPRPGYLGLLTGIVGGAPRPPFAAVMMALTALRERLPWDYHYAPRPGEEDLADRIGFAELIGPDGPMSAPGARVGLTLVAPHTAYPMHAHPAVELYWVIAGNARWMTPSNDRIVPPGTFILHRSGEPHAMHSFEEPLLALWAWSGDVDTPACYV